MPIDPTQNHDDAAQPGDAPEGFRAAFADGDDTEGHLRVLADEQGAPDGFRAMVDGDDDDTEGHRIASF